MSLPNTRDLTYSAGTPVQSANLNNIQDCIVAGKVGQVAKWLPIENLGNTGKWNRGASSNTYWFEPNVNPAEAVFDLPLLVGDRIVEVKAYVYDNNGAGDNITLKIWKQSIATGAAPGAAVQVGSTDTSDSAASTNMQDLVVTPGTPETVLLNTKYVAEIITGGGTLANYRLYAIKVTYDHP